MLLSIDPGVNNAGVALWRRVHEIKSSPVYMLEEARLILAMDGWLSLSQEVAYWASDWGVQTVVIERPQIYHQSKLKGDPNDLITLALAAGAIANALTYSQGGFDLKMVYPRQWKGQVPKAISNKRSADALCEREKKRVALPKAKSLHHNVYDAIGIGLWAIGRRSKKQQTNVTP